MRRPGYPVARVPGHLLHNSILIHTHTDCKVFFKERAELYAK